MFLTHLCIPPVKNVSPVLGRVFLSSVVDCMPIAATASAYFFLCLVPRGRLEGIGTTGYFMVRRLYLIVVLLVVLLIVLLLQPRLLSSHDVLGGHVVPVLRSRHALKTQTQRLV
jgi:hypothetical protein